MLVLASHSESWQDVIVSVRRPLRLEDAESGTVPRGRRTDPPLAHGVRMKHEEPATGPALVRLSGPPDGRPEV